MLLTQFLAAQGVLCLFIALSLVGPLRQRSVANGWFAAFFLAYGLVFLDRWTLASGFYESQPWIIEWLTSAEIFLPILLYIGTRVLVHGQRRSIVAERKHVVPIAVYSACRIPILSLTPEARLHWEQADTEAVLTAAVEQGRMSGDVWLEVSGMAADLVFLTALGIYFVASVRLLLTHQERIREVLSEHRRKELGWLSRFLATFGVLWSIYFFVGAPSEFDSLSAALLATVEFGAVLALALCVIAQVNVYTRDQIQALRPQNARYAASGLKEADLMRIASKLDEFMARELSYLDSGLSLPQLAKALGVSTNYLSQTLNQVKGLSFYDYVNGLRIEQAQRLLREQPDMAVIDVAMQCGFNSKSTFNSAFKRSVKMTPSQYRSDRTSAR